jgi:hypothetical protein
LSRFDRQATEAGDLPALLGTATEEFRRSLERHVQQIVEAAKSQAAEIERDAQRSATQKQQELDLRSQELVKGVITRASSVLDSIELVQTAISGMLAELRAEVKALESGESGQPSDSITPHRPRAAIATNQDQRIAKVAPTQPPQPERSPAAAAPPQPDPAPAAAAPPQPDPAPPATSPPASSPAEPTPKEEAGPLIEGARDDAKPPADRKDSSAEFDQMIHGEIRRMFHSGKSREDVESFLGRFELGDSYAGLLDELYSQSPSGRRRIFGRRRDR